MDRQTEMNTSLCSQGINVTLALAAISDIMVDMDTSVAAVSCVDTVVI